MTKKIRDFINSVFANTQIRDMTGGRIFEFTTPQGTHEYPFIFWFYISDKAMTTDLQGAGQAWQAEIQITCFSQTPQGADELAHVVYDAFTKAPRTDGILHCYSTQVIPLYIDTDEATQYALRIFINYQL